MLRNAPRRHYAAKFNTPDDFVKYWDELTPTGQESARVLFHDTPRPDWYAYQINREGHVIARRPLLKGDEPHLGLGDKKRLGDELKAKAYAVFGIKSGIYVVQNYHIHLLSFSEAKLLNESTLLTHPVVLSEYRIEIGSDIRYDFSGINCPACKTRCTHRSIAGQTAIYTREHDGLISVAEIETFGPHPGYVVICPNCGVIDGEPPQY